MMMAPRTIRESLAAPLALLWLLCACPQAIETPDGGLPEGADAAYQPPTCPREGPSFSCTAQNPGMLLVKEIASFQCSLPSDARGVRFKTLRTDHPEAMLGVQQDNTAGSVAVQLQQAPPPPFPDSTFRVFITLAWDDDPDACTVQEVQASWAGDLWVADPDNQQVVILDSVGDLAGTLKLDGMEQPRVFGRASDGVVVAGQSGSSAALAVYDYSGRKVRDVGSVGGALSGKPVRAVAALGTSFFVTTGLTQADATLYRVTTGAPQKLAQSAAALAPINDRLVIAGLATGASYLQLTPDDPSGNTVASASYHDATGALCPVSGAYAAVSLAAGGFLFSLRHADGGGAPTLGMLALFDSGFAVKAVSAHSDASLPGGLLAAGSFDWLEELRPGLVVGSRDSGASLQRVDVSTIGHQDTVQAWGSLPGSTMPKGLLRLR